MVDAILDASARILEVSGPSGLNTNAIAELAGVSVGSLYQYFPDKDAILAELVRREESLLADSLETALNRALPQSFDRVVDELIRVTVDRHMDRPVLSRFLEEAELRLTTSQEQTENTQRIMAILAKVVMTYPERFADIDPAQAIADAVVITAALANADVISGKSDRDGLHGRIRRALLGYLEYRGN